MSSVYRFEYVYYGDKSVPAHHLHEPGMCGHSDGLQLATADQRATLPKCEQCVNRIVDLGGEVGEPRLPEPCPSCFIVGPCECED